MSAPKGNDKNLRVRHRIYDDVYGKVRSLLTFAADSTIILVLGPSKTGKSYLMNHLFEDYPSTDDKIPAIATDAVALSSSFSMLHLTYRYLGKLRHPKFMANSKEEWKAGSGRPPMPERRARGLR